jgi:phosphoribosyl-AMP cyclohydrolase
MPGSKPEPSQFHHTNDVIAAASFNDAGLVPVIAVDDVDGTVLMMAWMNEDTLTETLASKTMVYWSRSRGQRWRKGDTSGHTQKVVSVAVDCDGDTLLFRVVQHGSACHTGERSCFFRELTL